MLSKVLYLILILNFLTTQLFHVILANNVYPSAFDILSQKYTNNVTFEKIEKLLQQNSFELTNNNLNYNDKMCIDQLNALVDGLQNLKLWAISIADSWGKIPTGVLSGNFYELGNFDQCLGVLYPIINQHGNVTSMYKGQYCLIEYPLPMNILAKNDKLSHEITNNNQLRTMVKEPFSGINIGICSPNTCSPEFLKAYFEELVAKILEEADIQLPFPIELKVPKESCQESKYVPYTSGDIFAIVFFSFIACLMVASTALDFFTRNRINRPNQNLIAFSIYSNGEKLFLCKRNESSSVMECINGIRVLSIVWVIFCHAYVTCLMTPLNNTREMFEWMQQVYSKLVLSGFVAVDTFFLLSGLFVAWSLLKGLDNGKGRVNLFSFYGHRYLRLTPAFAAAILYFSTIMKYAGDGPVFASFYELQQDCADYWWTSLLYVQNYVNPERICLLHSWYLSVDMQLYLLSPLLIYPLWRWGLKFVWLIPVLILLSMACTFSIFMIYDYRVSLIYLKSFDRLLHTYFATHLRMGAWLVGVLLGYILHNLKGKSVQLSKKIVFSCWIITLASMLAIIFGIYPMYLPNTQTTVLDSAFYESFNRVAWVICLAWIIFACVNGYGGPIAWFLSFSQWQPLARMSYSIYLVHFPIQMLIANSAKTQAHFNDLYAIHKFWADFGLGLTAALIWTLAFESPVLILEKAIFNRKPRRVNQLNNNNANNSKEDLINSGQYDNKNEKIPEINENNNIVNAKNKI